MQVEWFGSNISTPGREVTIICYCRSWALAGGRFQHAKLRATREISPVSMIWNKLHTPNTRIACRSFTTTLSVRASGWCGDRMTGEEPTTITTPPGIQAVKNGRIRVGRRSQFEFGRQAREKGVKKICVCRAVLVMYIVLVVVLEVHTHQLFDKKNVECLPSISGSVGRKTDFGERGCETLCTRRVFGHSVK